MNNIMKNIGKGVWIVLGIFLLIITVSWSRYAFGDNGFGSVIILFLLPIFAVLLIVYLIATAIYFIRNRRSKR